MGVYNGENFLEEQILSIQEQQYTDWHLMIRDDGSRDNSANILNRHRQTSPRITILENTHGNRGVKKNFESLMQAALSSEGKYFAFSDQDDVWHPKKLLKQVAMIKKIERDYPELPVLVHSDMEVVDHHRTPVHPSFMDYQGISHIHGHHDTPLKTLLIKNYVSGCTILVNRRLLEIALPVPSDALIHDWWLALCSVTFGKMGFIDAPLIQYRQHPRNTIGARNITNFINPFHSRGYRQWMAGRKRLLQSFEQAKALKGRINERKAKRHPCFHTHNHTDIINNYISLPAHSPLKRIKLLKQYGFHSQYFMGNLAMHTRMLAFKSGEKA